MYSSKTLRKNDVTLGDPAGHLILSKTYLELLENTVHPTITEIPKHF